MWIVQEVGEGAGGAERRCGEVTKEGCMKAEKRKRAGLLCIRIDCVGFRTGRDGAGCSRGEAV